MSSILDSLLDISSEAILCVNEWREIILFNTGAVEIFGYNAEEIIGQPVDLLLPASSQGTQGDILWKTTNGRDGAQKLKQRAAVVGRRKNGELFPAEASVSSHEGGEGPVYAVLLVDTSQQKKMEERLLKLSVVVEQTPATVMVTDTSGKIEYVNPAFERITGYTAAEVIGANPRILKSGLMSDELYREMWGTIAQGKVWKGELCNRKKSGELYWDIGTVSPILNDEGKITNFIAVKEDITERKKKDEELHQYRQHLETLVEARTVELRQEIEEHRRTADVLREKERRLAEAQRIGRLGSWEWSTQTSRFIWSDEFFRIVGLDFQKEAHHFQDPLQMVHPDDLEAVKEALNDLFSNGQPFTIDHRIVLADGKVRTITLNAVPVFDDGGIIVKVIGTVQDISERMRVELELREKERLDKELAIGRSIQLGLLPKDCPSAPGWQFAAFYQAANEVGGDFYDFIPLLDGQIGILVADISGKGVPAALMMALSRAIVRTIAINGSDPALALMRSNETLAHDFSDGEFLTAFYASLHPQSGRMTFANAGHNLALWYSSKLGEIKALTSQGMALGVFPEVAIEQETVNIAAGDVMLLYTDGLTDSQDSQDHFYEKELLMDVFAANVHLEAEGILQAVVQSWRDFAGECAQADDLTILVVKRVSDTTARDRSSEERFVRQRDQ